MAKTQKRSEPAKAAKSNVIQEGALAEFEKEETEPSKTATQQARTGEQTALADLRGGFYEPQAQTTPEQSPPPQEPAPEKLGSALEELEAKFQSRKTRLLSVLEGWSSADAQDRAALENLSAHYANQSLLEAQRFQEQALTQLLAATDKNQIDQLKALQAAIDALRSKIEALEQKDADVMEEMKKADERRAQAATERQNTLAELGKADEALAETLLSTLKKAIEMKPSQPKPAEPKPKPVIVALDDEDAARVTDQADMLRLQKRSVEFDRKVVQAIDAVAKSSRKWRRPVISALREWGLSTKVEQVIRSVDRRRLTDVRRQVLDAALPEILAELINEKGREGFAKMARDSVSVADEIISRLDGPDGPLDEVVKDVAVRAIKERGLENTADNRAKLEKYLRLSFEEPRA